MKTNAFNQKNNKMKKDSLSTFPARAWSRGATSMLTALSVSSAVLFTSEPVMAQNQEYSASGPISQPHFSQATRDSREGDGEAIAREAAAAIGGRIEQPQMTPTPSSFLAKGRTVRGATGYRLDVSTTHS